MRLGRRALPLVLAALGSVACVTEPDIAHFEGGTATLESEKGLARAEITLENGGIVLGENVFFIHLEPVFGEGVARLGDFSAFMPAHGHGTSLPVLTETADGWRVTEVMLFMPGRWDITLDVAVDENPDEIVFVTDVK